MIGLHSLKTIHERLPKGDDKKSVMSFAAFERLVEEHGTYHQFGSVRLMTEQDYNDLLRLTAKRRTRPAQPSPNEPGQMVFIGHAFDPSALVFIGWAPLGQEFELLDRIREGAQEAVMILCNPNATPADVEKFKETHKKAWRFGGWFGRTDELIEAMCSFNSLDESEEEGEVVEQVSQEAGGSGARA